MREDYQPLRKATVYAASLGAVLGIVSFAIAGEPATISSTVTLRIMIVLGLAFGLGLSWLAERISGLGGAVLWLPTLAALAAAVVVTVFLILWDISPSQQPPPVSLYAGAVAYLGGAWARIETTKW